MTTAMAIRSEEGTSPGGVQQDPRPGVFRTERDSNGRADFDAAVIVFEYQCGA
jgi:hypothetical protein